MAVFISRDFDDEGSYNLLRLGLDTQNIKYFDTKTLEPGKPLAEQLRQKIEECDVCVFLVTANSVASAWCAAEVGAFWGAHKRVICYKADSAVDVTKAAPQFQADLWTSDPLEVIRVAKQDIEAASERRRREAARRPRLVSEMTITTLYDVLSSLKNQFPGDLPLHEAMRVLHATVEGSASSLPDAEALAQPLVRQLVGVPREVVQEAAGRHWPVTFTLQTETGLWLGFAKSLTGGQLLDVYANCLLVFCDAKSNVAAAAAVGMVRQQEAKIYCDGRVAHFGETQLGEAQALLASGSA